jgi:Methyltransferase domain
VARGGRRPVAVGVWDVLVDPRAPRSDWSINQMLAIELAAYLDRARPRRILEVGSGYSTAILAAYAAHYDADVVTLEHDETYFRRTRRALRLLGVDRPLDLRLAPLCQHWFGSRGPYRWYDVALDGEFDFVFIDGPPKVLGRRGVFFALQDHLRPGWQVWVDDGDRKHERVSVELWEKSFSGNLLESYWDIGGKGVFVLRDALGDHDQMGDSDRPDRLGIAVLGGGDPDWWEQAARSFGERVLRRSHVVVSIEEPPGQALPDAAASFVNAQVPADRGQQERMLAMFRSLAAQPGVRYVLHLDDRWSLSTLDTTWLRRALGILDDQPDVEQVALRHLIDVGVEDGGGQRPFPGSFTREPSLLRADRLGTALQADRVIRPRSLWRVGTRLGPAPLWTVQLVPGAFRLSDAANRSAEAPVDTDGSQPFPAGAAVAQAGRSRVAVWNRARRVDRLDGVSSS